MRTNLITTLVLSTMLAGCTQQIDTPSTTMDQIEIETQDSPKPPPSNLNAKDTEIEKRAIAFFSWYVLNSNDWIRNSEDVVGVKENYYFLDSINLTQYISWLSKSNFFSNSYLKNEEEKWKGDCHLEMLKLKKEGREADGPPPCVYEGDIIFLSQDVDVKKAVAKISMKIDSSRDNYAIVDYGASKLYWTKENGTWKISSLHYR